MLQLSCRVELFFPFK